MSFKDRVAQRGDEARPIAYDASLMCSASGCPNRWSVHMEGRGRLCSAHAWKLPAQWPGITQEQLQLDEHKRWGVSTKPLPLAPVAAPASGSKAWNDLHGGE